MVLVPLFDLKFLLKLAAGAVGTSNRRHGHPDVTRRRGGRESPPASVNQPRDGGCVLGSIESARVKARARAAPKSSATAPPASVRRNAPITLFASAPALRSFCAAIEKGDSLAGCCMRQRKL